MTDIALRRLHNQRLSSTRFRQPEDVVRWLGAVQAQEYPDAKWALALRMTRTTDAAIEQAMTDGRLLRMHVLRPTWHFVVAEDIRWMLQLTGPRVSARMAPYNRRLELDATVFRRSQKAIVAALRGGNILTRQELKTVLQAAGIVAGDVQRLAHIVMQAELEGVVCSGPRRGKQITYALLDERVPAAPVLTRDDALAELTRRYFTGHGPAQIKDFVWWSGLTTTDARSGIEMAGAALRQEIIGGKTYWSGSGARRPARSAAPRAWLLPIYDEYLIAYADRSAASVPDRARRPPTTPDVFSAPLVLDGLVIGSWKRTVTSRGLAITLRLPTRLNRTAARTVDDAFARYAAFLGHEIDVHYV